LVVGSDANYDPFDLKMIRVFIADDPEQAVVAVASRRECHKLG
jgi:hypothetical protein